MIKILHYELHTILAEVGLISETDKQASRKSLKLQAEVKTIFSLVRQNKCLICTTVVESLKPYSILNKVFGLLMA